MSTPLLEVNDLKKHFPIRAGFLGGVTGHVYAVDGISFSIAKGETLSLVGESGCGKSTVGKAILRLFDITGGQVMLDGTRIDDMPAATLRPMRRRMQVVFQDPYSSLNPRMRVRDILAEPIRNFGLAKDSADLEKRVGDLMDRVRLPRDAVGRWPHEFSGGQRQRIGIARALALNPKFIVCDEPIAALDVSIQAQVVNLLEDLQDKLGLTYLFISHDLSMVRHIADRVAVMYLGRIVELSPRDDLYARPLHPYAEALLSAVNEPNPERARTRSRILLKGDLPSPANPPKGCNFCTRCPKVFDRCLTEKPALVQVEPGRKVACHLFQTLKPTAGSTGGFHTQDDFQQGVTL